MRILLTGSSGTLGRELLPLLLERGHTVYALRHQKPIGMEHSNLIEVPGDVVSANGLQDFQETVDRVIHCAATVALGRHSSECFHINSRGTLNVLHFAAEHGCPQVEYVSTAFLKNRNPYEKSKKLAEDYVALFRRGYGGELPKVPSRIYRPGILLSSHGGNSTGAFSQFFSLAAKVHHRAEVARRYLEGKLRLPKIKPVLRIRGDPQAPLNLILAEDVARAIANFLEVKTSHKSFYLTNPDPPKLWEIAKWAGEVILVDVEYTKEEFQMTPVEELFHRLAAPFLPYLWGDRLPSDIPVCTPITQELVRQVTREVIL